MQCIVVMYQLYVPHRKHSYHSTMCALHSRLTTRLCIVVMHQLYVLHRKQPYHSTVCEAQVLAGCCLLGFELWTIIKRREQNDGFMMFKWSPYHSIQLYNKRAEIAIWVVCVLLTPHRLTGGSEEIQFPSSILLGILFGSHAKDSWR